MAGAHLTLPETHAGELVVDLAISAGELAIIAASDIHHADQIVDVICGLQMPRSGSVRFQGRDWRNVPNDHANARRGRIGSALGEGAWLPYLSMPDNILLPRLFHTQVPRDELLSEAVQLAQQ
jgi:ABC-type transporter Mla maintaining outer membrane lipid asymmetry ATPase subunit MlaF